MLGVKYIEAAEKAMTGALGQLNAVRKAAQLIARTATGGKRVYVIDPYGVVDSEIADKPGNLALIRSLQQSEEQLSAGDVLILSSFLPAEDRDLKIVTDAKSLGARVITISPGGRLAESADIAIQDSGEEMNGVLSSPGINEPFGPVSGIIHVLLMNLVQVEIAGVLMASGKTPSVLPGAYLAGGAEQLIEARRKFSSQGY